MHYLLINPTLLFHHQQLVLNAAARLNYGINRFDYIYDIKRDKLHWLRAGERIEFKLCLLIYKLFMDLRRITLPKYVCQLVLLKLADVCAHPPLET